MPTDRHEEIVEAILNMPADRVTADGMGFMQYLAEKYPDMSMGEFRAAMDEATAEMESARDRVDDEIFAMEMVEPLFDGMPEGMELGECARIKAERGDPLAIAFLKWEAQQAGGVQ